MYKTTHRFFHAYNNKEKPAAVSVSMLAHRNTEELEFEEEDDEELLLKALIMASDIECRWSRPLQHRWWKRLTGDSSIVGSPSIVQYLIAVSLEHEDSMAIAGIEEPIVHIPEDLYWGSINLNFLIAPELPHQVLDLQHQLLVNSHIQSWLLGSPCVAFNQNFMSPATFTKLCLCCVISLPNTCSLLDNNVGSVNGYLAWVFL
jgi:hypothetical protein